jgi:hypothetical protein
MFALFNSDLKFIGYSPDMPAQPHILKKEIPSHQRDLNVWKWQGDFNSGKMVSLFEEDVQDEEVEAEKRMIGDINAKYPLGVQMINIIRQLKLLADQNNSQDERFMDMAEEILNAMDKHDKRLKYVLARKKLYTQP